MARTTPIDEAKVPDRRRSASKPRWGVCFRQFDLVRSKEGSTYLTRWWLVLTPWGGIALHRMSAPDARVTLHDHPFSFVSIILRGGYTERRLDPRTMLVDEHRHVRWVNRMRVGIDAHSIRELDRPVVWTLLLVGRSPRTWGFLEPVEHRFALHDVFVTIEASAPTVAEDMRRLGYTEDDIASAEQLGSPLWAWTKHDAFDSGHYVP